MDYVQLHISWHNKVDVLALLTSFGHEMISTTPKSLIIGYFFQLHSLLISLRKIFEFFIYLGKYGLCTIVHIMTQ